MASCAATYAPWLNISDGSMSISDYSSSMGKWLLGALANLRKASISFVVSLRLTIRVGTARLPSEGFSWNLVFWICFENLSRKFRFI